MEGKRAGRERSHQVARVEPGGRGTGRKATRRMKGKVERKKRREVNGGRRREGLARRGKAGERRRERGGNGGLTQAGARGGAQGKAEKHGYTAWGPNDTSRCHRSPKSA